METRTIVSVVIEKDGKFLFGKKPQNIGPYPNTWHLLGGGIKQKESLTNAIKREVLEESGIEITDIEPISFDEDFEPNKEGVETHYVFLVFKARYKAGKLKPKDDITELKWVGKTSLSNVELNRPTIKLFKKLKFI